MPDDYNSKDEDKKKEKQIKDSMNIHGQAFNPSSIKKSEKYEYPFLGKDEKYVYTFLSCQDPYEATKDERLRAKWLEEAKILYGDFTPSGASKPISTVCQSKLKDIVDIIKKLLLADWNDVNFVIGSK